MVWFELRFLTGRSILHIFKFILLKGVPQHCFRTVISVEYFNGVNNTSSVSIEEMFKKEAFVKMRHNIYYVIGIRHRTVFLIECLIYCFCFFPNLQNTKTYLSFLRTIFIIIIIRSNQWWKSSRRFRSNFSCRCFLLDYHAQWIFRW